MLSIITLLVKYLQIFNYDPGLWKNIDGKFRDLMIKKDPIRHDNF